MDEIKKSYYDDLKEKSAIARSARLSGRKYGERKYTKKELEAMSGPTHSVNLNQFIPYEEFKRLPDTLKKEYLTHIVETWNVGANAIARMWGLTSGTTSPMMKRLGVNSLSRHSGVNATRRFFDEFVNGKTEPLVKKMTFCNASVSFIGIYDEQSILTRFKNLVPDYMPVKITITVEATE